jgi:Tfp pilus assembly protein PilF
LRARLLGYRLLIVGDAFLHHHGSRTFQALGVDYAAALAHNRQLFLARWRDDPVGLVALAHGEGELELAAQGAAAAMRRHPRWPDGDLILGRQLHRQGESGPAIEHLRRFLARCPLHTDAWILLAFETMRLRGQAAGDACLRHALATCAFSPEATQDMLQLYGAWHLESGHPEAAAAKFEAALELGPRRAHFHNLLGKAWLDAGAFERAEQCFARAMAGGEPRGILGQGVCQWRAGRWQEGLVTLSRAVQELPGDVEANANLEAALQELERRGVDLTRLRHEVQTAGAAPPGAASPASPASPAPPASPASPAHA